MQLDARKRKKQIQLDAKKRKKQMQLPQDLISSLPDEILLAILSFSTVKDMLVTNFLSSRWLNLWVNTPVLDFQVPYSGATKFYEDMDRNKFVEWVNSVLPKHKCSYLKKFRVEFNLDQLHRSDIDSWLEFALARKVEILELNFLVSGWLVYGIRGNYVLPDCFSSGKASLDGSMSRFIRQAELKCLKSLSLKRVGVTSEAIHTFLAHCPFLERLVVVSSDRLFNLVISDPTLALKYLQIQYCFKLEVVSISKINIVSLDISYGRLKDISLRDLPMLVNLSIPGFPTNLRHILSQNAKFLPQLEALTLTAFQSKEITMLSDLAHLKKLKRLVIKAGADGDENLINLFASASFCPHLEDFVLMMFWLGPDRTNRTKREVERLSSKNRSLKYFEFKGYYARVCDIEFVMHVAENAPALEKIIIDPCEFRRDKHRSSSVISAEMKARSIALNQFEQLRESKYIPPHVDVLIRPVPLE